MAVGLPLKTTYADGDVYSASDVNDTNGTINTTAAPYAAGKNKIINGDFRINQRAFTNTTTTGTYGMDRWRFLYSGGTTTFSIEAFTLGAAPVAGYEGTNFARLVTTSQSASSDRAVFQQRIESVRTFAGQTATFSFWAKSASGTPNVNVVIVQNFGSGGSPSTAVTTTSTDQSISTSWSRYSFTINVPSISGKTLGTANDDQLSAVIYVSDGGDFSTNVGAQNNTFDIWGVQLEAGSVATAFQTATGTLQGELAACQRYYYRNASTIQYAYYGQGNATSTTNARIFVVLPVQMRVAPPTLDYANLAVGNAVAILSAASAAVITYSTPVNVGVDFTTTGLTAGGSVFGIANTTSTAFIGFSAEL